MAIFMTTARPTLSALTRNDIETVIRLGREIWLAYYVDIIGRDQVEYMIDRRFTRERLLQYLDASERDWLVLKWQGEAIGFCSYALAPTPGELKLEQLYVRHDLRGRGFGKWMLREIEHQARSRNCELIALQVNKRNAASIAIYKKSGFVIREAAVFPIGGGFVMDDYVMEKRLSGSSLGRD